jgi:hypothetical protein
MIEFRSQYEERSLIMIDSESESYIARQHAMNEADAEENLRREFWEHPEILEQVVERKKRRFTRSGLLLVVIGAILINYGLRLNTGIKSLEGLIVGVGVLVALVGILRFLIGLIRPIVPSQM